VDETILKFDTAIKIGKVLKDPKQCDYIFTGCPFSHEEILDIINEPEKTKLLVQKKSRLVHENDYVVRPTRLRGLRSY